MDEKIKEKEDPKELQEEGELDDDAAGEIVGGVYTRPLSPITVTTVI